MSGCWPQVQRDGDEPEDPITSLRFCCGLKLLVTNHFNSFTPRNATAGPFRTRPAGALGGESDLAPAVGKGQNHRAGSAGGVRTRRASPPAPEEDDG